MTPTEFSGALIDIGWTKGYLAQRLGCNPALCAAWASGAVTVPPPIAAWLGELAALHTAHPPPPWRKNPGFGLNEKLARR